MTGSNPFAMRWSRWWVPRMLQAQALSGRSLRLAHISRRVGIASPHFHTLDSNPAGLRFLFLTKLIPSLEDGDMRRPNETISRIDMPSGMIPMVGEKLS